MSDAEVQRLLQWLRTSWIWLALAVGALAYDGPLILGVLIAYILMQDRG